jgi:hypothetical protein
MANFECNSCGIDLSKKIKTLEYKIRNNQLCCVSCGTMKYRKEKDAIYHTKLMIVNLGIDKTLLELLEDYKYGFIDPRIKAYNRDVLNINSGNPLTMGRIYYI